MSTRLKAYLALLTASILWGLSPPIIKYSLGFTTPMEFLFWRFLLVSIIVLPLYLVRIREKPFEKKDYFSVFIFGLCGTSLTLGLYFWGLSKTSSLDATVISAISPLLVVAGGAFILKEVISRMEKIGIVLTVFGSIIALVLPYFLYRIPAEQRTLFGTGLIFLGDLTWAIFSLLEKKLLDKYSFFTLTAASFFIGAISFFPFFVYQRLTIIPWSQSATQIIASIFTLNMQAFPGILYMTFFGSVIAYFAYAYGVALIDVSEAVLFTYLQPIFTLPLAIFWLKEKTNLTFLLGSVIIISGVVLTEWRPKKKIVDQKA